MATSVIDSRLAQTHTATLTLHRVRGSVGWRRWDPPRDDGGVPMGTETLGATVMGSGGAGVEALHQQLIDDHRRLVEEQRA